MRLRPFLLFAPVPAVLVLMAGLGWYALQRPIHQQKTAMEFEVPAGAGAQAIARRARAEGLAVSEFWMLAAAYLRGQVRKLQAGVYELPPGATTLDLLDLLVQGRTAAGRFTIIEGWTLKQLRAALAAEPALRPDSAGLDEAALAERLGLPAGPLEGRFLPDTYLFNRRSSDLDVLRRAHRAMEAHLASVWPERSANLPWSSPTEALIAASMVEKEAGLDSDRALIASVFANRLRVGMLLQSDPSVIYGMGEAFDGNLRKRDLRIESPYNTYRYPGLPPTPIALPGKRSIAAVLAPEPSGFFYFVARGDGSSQFSVSLEEHNRAVSRFQRGGRS